MPLTPAEANQSLKEIERAEKASSEARLYANASPQCISWGVLLATGYAATDWLASVQPRAIYWLWGAVTLAGLASTVLIRLRQRRDAPGGQTGDMRRGATYLVLLLFAFATFAIFRPHDPLAPGAFFPLIQATSYAVFGVWRGLRFVYAGVALAAVTLVGLFCLREHFLLWMAVFGGGSLILVGFWLKKV